MWVGVVIDECPGSGFVSFARRSRPHHADNAMFRDGGLDEFVPPMPVFVWPQAHLSAGVMMV